MEQGVFLVELDLAHNPVTGVETVRPPFTGVATLWIQIGDETYSGTLNYSGKNRWVRDKVLPWQQIKGVALMQR